MFSRWPIRHQVLLLVAVLVVPLTGVLVYNAWQSVELRRFESQQRAEQIEAVVAAHVTQLTDDAEGLLRTIASLPPVRRQEAPRCEPLASTLIAPDALFVDAMFVRPDGTIVCHASGHHQEGRVTWPWLRAAVDAPGLYISKPFRDEQIGRWTAMYTYPIPSEDGRIFGIFGLQVDLETLSATLAKSGSGSETVVQIIDRDNVVIARSSDPVRWIGRDVSEAAFLGQPGEMVVSRGLEGTERVFSKGKVARPPWTVYVGMSTQAISGPVLKSFYIGAVVTVLATGLALLIGFALVWRIVRPVSRLVDAFAQTSRNGALKEFAEHSPPELASLATRYADVIAAHQKAAQGEHLLAKVFESSQEAMMITDENRRIVAVNRAFEEDTGFSATEALGQDPSIISSGRHDRRFFCDLFRSLEETGRWSGEIWNRRKNGEIFPCFQTVTRIEDEQGNLFYIGIMLDISQQKKLERELEYLVNHDPLTELPNRILFIDRFRQAVAANSNGRRVALMYIDIDRFKPINENVGVLAGDKLLLSIRDRLRECLRESDTLARLGSDEFAIIVSDLASREALLPVIRKIFAEVARPFEVEGHSIAITISMGVCLHPDDSEKSATLKRFAEVALHRAKAEGGNRYAFYTSALTERAERRFALENALREALDNKDFTLVFEPQYAKDGSLAGCEALIRWSHPQLGRISPLEFLPILEELGLIDQVTEWVIEEACRQLAGMRERGIPMPRISVNLSPLDLEKKDFAPFIERITKAFGLEPGDLELEITEGALMQDPEQAEAAIHGLRTNGIRVAIDDFGTGYSSLSYLKNFEANVLKIDRSFVTHVDRDKSNQEIVRAVVALGHAMGMSVLAEGVERTGELEWLKAQGCDLFQGYLFGRPVRADQLRP